MTSPELMQQVNRALFDAWTSLADGVAVDVAAAVPVPGAVELRGRFHFLADAEQRVTAPAAAFVVSWERWSEQVAAARDGDAALVADDVASAQRAFERLIELQEPGRSTVPTVDGLAGLADAARQADDVDAAIGFAERALTEADAIGYRFGQVRSLTTLGYLTLRAGSAGRAREIFTRAREVAQALDERLYEANALAGVGEASARLREFEDAKDALSRAGRRFAELRSLAGVANAAQHLGDVHRRLGEVAAAVAALTTARDASEQAGLVIGAVNANDALGEVYLADGNLDAAVAAHHRAFEVSDRHGYRRGQAHALNGLARCAFAVEEWQTASDLVAAGGAVFEQLDDPASASVAFTGQARCAEALGDVEGHVRWRLAAVGAVESIRSAQSRHVEQVEYVERFADVYWHAFRASAASNDAAAFLAVFEAVAGRRLAAMLSSVPQNASEAALLGQLLARAQDRPLGGGDLSDSVDSHTRRARLLGRLGLRGALPDKVEQALDDAVTTLVRPFEPESAATVLAGLPLTGHVLLLAFAPGREDRVVWCWRAPGGSPLVGGVTASVTPDTVAGLGALMPDEFRDAVLDGDGLLLVPVGDLWSVPWPALPAGREGRLLGETVALTVAPSASVAASLPSQVPLTEKAAVTWWTGPDVAHHALRAYDGDPRVDVQRLSDAGAARAALTSGSNDVVVVFAHGRPADGIGHYLQLGTNEFLTPADLLTACTPPLLALISCWGARTPGAAPGDPMTLATIALVRGSATVLATNAELADDPSSSAFINDVLYLLLAHSPAEAVRAATKRRLARSGVREEPVMMWAPLLTIGTG